MSGTIALTRPRRRMFLWAWVCLVAGPILAAAQDPPGASTPSLPAIEQVEQRAAAAAQDATLAEATKTQVAELYRQTLDALARIQDWRARIAEYEAAIRDAPDQLAAIQTSLEAPPADLYGAIPPEASLTQMDQLLTQTRADLTRLQDELAKLRAEPARRLERRRGAPELLASTRARLQKAEEEAALSATADEIPQLTDARLASSNSRIEALRLEVAAYEQELQSYEATSELLTQRIAQASRQAAQQERLIEALAATVAARRQQEAAQAVLDARRVLTNLGEQAPEVRALIEDIARENQTLTERRSGADGIAQKIEAAETLLVSIEQQLNDLRKNFARVKDRADAAGSSHAVGLLLRRYAAALPKLGNHRRAVKTRQEVVASVSLEQMELQDQWLDLADLDETVQEELKVSRDTIPPGYEEELAVVLRDLLDAKKKNIEALRNDYEAYFGKLVDLNAKEADLVAEAEIFRDFITEHALYIRSDSVPRLQTLADGQAAWLWLTDMRAWATAVRAFGAQIVQNPSVALLAAAALVVLLAPRRRIKQALALRAQTAAKSSCTDIVPTYHAIVHTLVLAAGAPFGLAAMGWLLATTDDRTDYARHLGAGLLAGAACAFAFGIAIQLLRKDGVCIAHFGWPEGASLRLQKYLRHALPWLVLLTVCAWIFESAEREEWKESLGRLAFLVAMGILIALARQALHPETGPLTQIWKHKQIQLSRRTFLAIRYAAVGVPSALFVAAFVGYYYTAIRLSTRIGLTTALLLGLLFLSGVALRYVQLARRRIARDQARKRREAMKLDEMKLGDTLMFLDTQEINLEKVDAQTQRMVKTFVFFSILVGLWFAWADMVPALDVLNRYEIGGTLERVTHMVPQPDGTEKTELELVRRAITLGDLLIAVIVILLTIAAVNNIPGVLEIVVLQRFGLGAGERYAAASIVRYALVAFGVVVFFRALGIGWDRVQWLVAALSLGLGFGLQEIFANFMSGLILLFERPIRVGDTVTVGGISGTVTRMRIRATTITGFDRKELIVPNKEFVTGQLVNWTLSDPTIRVIIPVGVSYNSNPAQVTDALLDVAHASLFAVSDPAPDALFLGFGDNALNFELRVFCDSMENYIRLQHEMHMRITQAFREKGIEIAFPQRDIHIRSIDADLPLIEKRNAPQDER